VPGLAMVVGGIKEVKYAFQATWNVQKRLQNSAGFPQFLPKKSLKARFL
jgi:hypothetical protein